MKRLKASSKKVGQNRPNWIKDSLKKKSSLNEGFANGIFESVTFAAVLIYLANESEVFEAEWSTDTRKLHIEPAFVTPTGLTG